jgi:hypothetical protein
MRADPSSWRSHPKLGQTFAAAGDDIVGVLAPPVDEDAIYDLPASNGRSLLRMTSYFDVCRHWCFHLDVLLHSRPD